MPNFPFRDYLALDCRLSSIPHVPKTFVHVLITVSISTASWITISSLAVKMNRLIFRETGIHQSGRKKARATCTLVLMVFRPDVTWLAHKALHKAESIF